MTISLIDPCTNFALGQRTDLRAVKQTFDDAKVLLRHTASVIGEYVDIEKYIAADFRG